MIEFKNNGFTLIELLVVIAIMGILSSVVLASLNQARTQGSDAAVKQNLQTVRVQAHIYADDNNGDYGNITNCSTGVFSDPIVTNAINAAVSAAGGGSPTCNGDGTGSSQKYAVSGPLKSGGTWCVDSRGIAMNGDAIGGECQ